LFRLLGLVKRGQPLVEKEELEIVFGIYLAPGLFYRGDGALEMSPFYLQRHRAPPEFIGVDEDQRRDLLAQ
jgi:hypothetical protein